VDTYEERWKPERKTETVAVWEAAGRVLAKDYVALYDQPVVRASAMDGVAVKSEYFVSGTPDASGWKYGVEYVRADTGDDFDDEFDAVVPIEKIEALDNGGLKINLTGCPRHGGGPGGPGGAVAVKLSDANCDPGCKGKPDCDKKPEIPLTAGFSVRPAGSSVAKGTHLVSGGTVLGPCDLAALAAGGHATAEVVKKPVVAFIPTGSELISVGSEPKRGQTIDSNSVLAAAMLESLGAEAVLMPIVRDKKEELSAAIDKALARADIVLVNAGSSKGSEDFNAGLLEEKGELLCHWVSAAPGRPLAAAFICGKPVLNVPGPSLACYFVLDWCVSALVCQALGVRRPEKAKLEATLEEDMRFPPFMQILGRFRVEKQGDGYLAKAANMFRDGQTAGLTADAQFVNELGQKNPPKAGEKIMLELVRNAAFFGENGAAQL
jgi:molybdopterin molybdotransferase/putative molybdopterin biosynthesis protein